VITHVVTSIANPCGNDETNANHLLGETDDETTVLGAGTFGLVDGDWGTCKLECGDGETGNLPLMERRPIANPAMIRPINIIARLENQVSRSGHDGSQISPYW
jgi:hypothetical protein